MVKLEDALRTKSGSAVPRGMSTVERTLTDLFVIHPC